MKPILDFYKEEGIINKETYLKGSKEFDDISMIKKYKINTALFIFYRENLDLILDLNKMEELYEYKNASNRNKCFVYDKKFVIAFSPLGCPSAGAMMEELGFMGITNFFACGSAGQIDQNVNSKEFVLVDRAIRREGLSYHYLKPSLYVETDKDLTKFVEKFLKENNYNFNINTTWTTDAFYRETLPEIEKRIKQGAVCVEMECAGWAAVAKYRGYKFAQLLYFSDAVKQEGWGWHPSREELNCSVIKLMIDCVSKFCDKKTKNK